MKLAFKNKQAFLKLIDTLPTGPTWECRSYTVAGTLKDATGKRMTEDLELWGQNPIECIQYILNNKDLEGRFSYAPVRHWTHTPNLGYGGDLDSENASTSMGEQNLRQRIYSEAATGDWWWNTQVGRTRWAFSEA
jgi:hypothetical protein